MTPAQATNAQLTRNSLLGKNNGTDWGAVAGQTVSGIATGLLQADAAEDLAASQQKAAMELAAQQHEYNLAELDKTAELKTQGLEDEYRLSNEQDSRGAAVYSNAAKALSAGTQDQNNKTSAGSRVAKGGDRLYNTTYQRQEDLLNKGVY